jgi:hypothetical protein
MNNKRATNKGTTESRRKPGATRIFRVALEDKRGEFARVLSNLIGAGVTVESALMYYEDDGPMASFVVTEPEAKARVGLQRVFKELGGEESANASRLRFQLESDESLVDVTNSLSRAGANMCFAFYARGIEGEPMLDVRFFPASSKGYEQKGR